MVIQTFVFSKHFICVVHLYSFFWFFFTFQEQLKEYFGKYGTVESVMLKVDQNGKPRGFGFVTFETEDGREACLKDYSSHTIEGKWIEVKKAEAQGQKETVLKHLRVTLTN